MNILDSKCHLLLSFLFMPCPFFTCKGCPLPIPCGPRWSKMVQDQDLALHLFGVPSVNALILSGLSHLGAIMSVASVATQALQALQALQVMSHVPSASASIWFGSKRLCFVLQEMRAWRLLVSSFLKLFLSSLHLPWMIPAMPSTIKNIKIRQNIESLA